MNDRDELCDLWQSQPVERGRYPSPRFALVEGAAVPFYMPLSPWRRVSYLLGFVWTAIFYVRQGSSEGWLYYTAASLAVAVAVVGTVLVLWQRDRSRTLQLEESVSSYRTALANEFESQFRKERRILMLLLGGWVAPGALRFVGHLLKYRSVDLESLAATALLAALLTAGIGMYARAANAVRSRLDEARFATNR